MPSNWKPRRRRSHFVRLDDSALLVLESDWEERHCPLLILEEGHRHLPLLLVLESDWEGRHLPLLLRLVGVFHSSPLGQKRSLQRMSRH